MFPQEYKKMVFACVQEVTQSHVFAPDIECDGMGSLSEIGLVRGQTNPAELNFFLFFYWETLVLKREAIYRTKMRGV